MDEIILQLKNGRSVTALTIKGDTEDEAKVMAKAVAEMWQSASQDEKNTLKKMLASNHALDYLAYNESKLREFLKQAKDSNYLIRRDNRGTYHIIREKEAEPDDAIKNEADVIAQLRKRQAEIQASKQKKEQAESLKKHSKKDIASVVQEEMQPYLEGMYHDLRNMKNEINELRLKEDE